MLNSFLYMVKPAFRATGKWMAMSVLAMSSLSCLAQDESLRFLENKLTAYRNNTLQEKLFVHTDKATYLAGEFLWFKVYDVEGYMHQPLQVSRLAYLEILDTENKAVLQAKVSLKAGEDNGSLSLPLNLPTGNYKLRAYTNWMKNFGPEFFFEKEISIINPLSNAKVQANAPLERREEISFFPEGGYLVKDIPSILAFKGNDAYGKGLNFTGWLLDEMNDTVTAFSPVKFGMGSISFTPAGGHTYKASILFSDGRLLQKELPQALPAGYVMHLQKSSPSQLTIEVRASGVNSADRVYLLAHTREVIRVAEQAVLNNGTAVFTVDASRLEPGITQFTLFDANRQPVAERLYFVRPEKGSQKDVKTDKQEYSAREKIRLLLPEWETKQSSAPANASLSVHRVDSVQVPDRMNIENYLLLTSDLSGIVEAPEYYFEEPAAEREQAADNLMLTQGWRRFRWQHVLQEHSGFVASYPPEVNGQLVKANVLDARTGHPVSGVQTFLSLPGKQYQVYFARTNAAGQAQFELKEFYGNGEMVVRPFSADDSLYRIDVQNPFSEQYTSVPVAPLDIKNDWQKLLANYSLGMQVRQVYAGDSLNQLTAPQPADTFSFLGIPDYSYNLDEYTRFTTMEEVLREYIRPINVGVRKGKPHMIFIDVNSRLPTDENLLVMLDGVPVYEEDRLFSYDPLKVQKLDVFPRPYVLGTNYFFGVANFSTYKGSFDAFELDPRLVALNFQGLQLQREFYMPTYETPAQKASRLPDYRNTLYWNPNISLAGTAAAPVTFFSCDQKGQYLGVLQGLDNKGRPFVREFRFEVK